MRIILTTACLILSVLLLALQQQSSNSSTPRTEGIQLPHLQISDSIQLEMGEGVRLLDISPNGEHILVLSYPSRSLQVFNSSTKGISAAISLEEEPIQDVNSLIQWPSFYTNDQIIIPLSKGLLRMDLQGKVLHENLFSGTDELFYTYTLSKVQSIQIKGDLHFLMQPFNFPENAMTDRRRYQKWRSLVSFKPSTGQMEDILPLPSSSRYHDGMVYQPDFLKSTFVVINDTLWHNTSGDPILYAYANDGAYTSIGSIHLNLQAYELPKAISPTNPSANTRRAFPHIGGVKAIYPFNDDMAVLYFPGLSKAQQETLEKLREENNSLKLREWYNHAIAQIPHRLQIVSKTGEVKVDVEIPSSYHAQSLHVRNGEIWVQSPTEEIHSSSNKMQINTLYKLELINYEG